MGWLDDNGLIYVWSKAKGLFATKDSVNELKDSMGELGYGDMMKNVYDTNGNGIVDNAEKVNGHTVGSDVPNDAKFTDTVYEHPTSPGNKHIPSDGASGQILRWSASGSAVWGDESVKSVEGLSPDSNGNIELGSLVKGTVQGEPPSRRLVLDDGNELPVLDSSEKIRLEHLPDASASGKGAMSAAHYSKLEALPTNPIKNIDTDNGQIEPVQGVIMIIGSGGLSTDATGDILQITGNSATSNTMGMMSPAHYNKLEALPTNANLESTYAKKTDITNVYKYKGSVASESELPTSGQAVGDVYDIKAASSYGAAGMNVAWNGTAWDALGEKFVIDSITNATIDSICV